MHKRLSLFALALFSSSAFAAAPHWTYAGAHGPAHWGQIAPEFKECALGHAQSPIDIRAARIDANAPELDFHYTAQALRIVNNGHTVQVNEDGGTLDIGGHAYKLAQFHFHTPSEERIHGRAYDMVAHLVHKDDAGKLAVVAVLFQRGAANPALDPLLANMPLGEGPEHRVDAVKFDAASLLPAQHGYYHFAGSLTTPPCSEGVAWYVLKQPVTVSAAQLAQLHKLYNHNNRPVQALNGRSVIEHP